MLMAAEFSSAAVLRVCNFRLLHYAYYVVDARSGSLTKRHLEPQHKDNAPQHLAPRPIIIIIIFFFVSFVLSQPATKPAPFEYADKICEWIIPLLLVPAHM